MFNHTVKKIFLLSLTIAFSSTTYAQESAEDVAKELANPNTALASLFIKTQFRTFDGDLPDAEEQSGTTLLFQPALPFPREDGSKLIWRPAVPIIIEQPIYEGASSWGDDSGLGDISFDLLYAPKTEPGDLIGFGFIASLPTGDEDLGYGETTTLGPEFIWGKLSPKGVLGLFPNHQWDVAGDVDVNLTSLQVFAVYLPGGGWNVGSSPLMSYDWNAENGENEWTVPVNLSVGKTVVLNSRPWKFSFDVNYYVERKDAFAPEWMFQFTIAPVVENGLANWFR